MTANEAKEAFIKDKLINFNSRHGNFFNLHIAGLYYEKDDAGCVAVSLVLKDGKANSTMRAKLSECEIVA